MYQHLDSSSSPAPPAAAAAITVSQGDVTLNESEMEHLMFLEKAMIEYIRKESLLRKDGDRIVASFKETTWSLVKPVIVMLIIATMKSNSDETGLTAARSMFVWFLLLQGLVLFYAIIQLARLRANIVLLRQRFASYHRYVRKFIDHVKNKQQNNSAIDSNVTHRLNVLQQKSSIGGFFYLFCSQVLVVSIYIIVLDAFIRWFLFTVQQNAMIDLLKSYIRLRNEVAEPLSNRTTKIETTIQNFIRIGY